LDINTISKNPLFLGLELDEIHAMIPCLGLRTHHVAAGSFVVMTGERVREVGLLVKGEADIIKGDLSGNRVVVKTVEPGELFGEVYVCANVVDSPVSIQAVTDCEVLFFNFTRLISCCSNCCVFHAKVVANLLKIISRKTLALDQKVEVISKRTIREKLSCYLNYEMEKNGAQVFEIPFSRGKLAEYLSVDRSAMSRELSRMRDEGILEFTRRQFEIIDMERLIKD